MILAIDAVLTCKLKAATDLILQLEAAATPEQQLLDAALELSPASHFARVPADEDIGERLLMRHAGGTLSVAYRARVTSSRRLPPLGALGAVPPNALAGPAVRYLFESRYCPAERFRPFVETEFAGLSGGRLADALRQWVADRIAYRPGVSDTATSAIDTFLERQGVCRDFAHLLIALARAAGIPARFASVYAPGVDPPDFHAVAELFLAGPESGEWHLVDATGMAAPGEMAVIGVGRDAADVAFLTSFGAVEVTEKR
ncbi:MAG: transglutaminase family protein, partial [Sphingomonadaceae bacterium]